MTSISNINHISRCCTVVETLHFYPLLIWEKYDICFKCTRRVVSTLDILRAELSALVYMHFLLTISDSMISIRMFHQMKAADYTKFIRIQPDLIRSLDFVAEDSTAASSHDLCIGPEGMERLCQDIQTDPEDLSMLALAWKLKASQMGYFRKSEWINGMSSLE